MRITKELNDQNVTLVSFEADSGEPLDAIIKQLQRESEECDGIIHNEVTIELRVPTMPF